jgi:L,D-transpeptidase catalytic domain
LASARLRAALAGGAAVALVMASLGAADAATQPKPAHAKKEHAKKEPPPKPLDLPLIQVSISRQQLTLFENGVPVAHSPVSTGTAGHPTPTGIFSVIGKEIFHRSNIYSGAPMPYMQRITWSGVAMHAGVLPGYPASHGCIRLPHDFAVRLYGLTRMGARVLVMPHEVAPAPFENARLFTRPKPATDKVSEAAPPADTKPVHAVRTAESQTPVMSDALGEGLKSAASTAVTEAAKNEDAKNSAAAGPNGEPTTGTVVVKPVEVTPPQPIEMRKSFEPVTGTRTGTPTFQPAPAAQPEQAAPPMQPAQAVPAQPTAAADEFYGPERPMRPGPITVFVSKKEGKLFVRKGFQPVFSWPVKFQHKELPLGTHLYTAVDANPDGTSFRWQVVSVPVDTSRKAEKDKHVSRDKKGRRIETVVQPAVALPAATAAEALDRIEIPPVAVARISALMSKGASLIISDQGLGHETGTETDFIVLTR